MLNDFIYDFLFFVIAQGASKSIICNLNIVRKIIVFVFGRVPPVVEIEI